EARRQREAGKARASKAEREPKTGRMKPVDQLRQKVDEAGPGRSLTKSQKAALATDALEDLKEEPRAAKNAVVVASGPPGWAAPSPFLPAAAPGWRPRSPVRSIPPTESDAEWLTLAT